MEAVADVLTEYTGTLGLCPRDSQVIVEHEATPTSTYDGTTIFTQADMINCFMSATKPGVWENINRGAYLAIVNEETCAVTEQASSSSSGGSGAAGMSGSAAAGSGQSSGAGQATISLKTFGVNSTQPTADNPEQPFSVKMVMTIQVPQWSGGAATGTATPQRHLQEMHLREMKKRGLLKKTADARRRMQDMEMVDHLIWCAPVAWLRLITPSSPPAPPSSSLTPPLPLPLPHTPLPPLPRPTYVHHLPLVCPAALSSWGGSLTTSPTSSSTRSSSLARARTRTIRRRARARCSSARRWCGSRSRPSISTRCTRCSRATRAAPSPAPTGRPSSLRCPPTGCSQWGAPSTRRSLASAVPWPARMEARRLRRCVSTAPPSRTSSRATAASPSPAARAAPRRTRSRSHTTTARTSCAMTRTARGRMTARSLGRSTTCSSTPARPARTPWPDAIGRIATSAATCTSGPRPKGLS